MPIDINELHKQPSEDFSDLTFGDRLRAVRKARGLTQIQLAEKAGISQCMVSFYERDEVLPGMPHLEWMCIVLKVSATDLLGF